MPGAPNAVAVSRQPDTTVVLLAPELFATPPEHSVLHAMLTQLHPRARLLMRVAAPTDLATAEALAQAGVDVELLVPAGMTLPPTQLHTAQMPPGSADRNNSDMDELALALADALLVGSASPDPPLVQLARKLEKQLVVPGARLPSTLTGTQRSIAHRLDPEQPSWHRVLRWFWGRLEQFYLELAAFNWQGRKHDGIATSSHRMRACLLGSKWDHAPHFAPEQRWKELALDRAAMADTSPIVARFNRLDRSALHGAYIHRDLGWAAYLAAAFAVLFAVAGHIRLCPALPDRFWPTAELVALFIILVTTVFSRAVNLQDRWTACRFGAEQLRIARMCLPLLVVPSALCSVDTRNSGDASLRALAEVKRAVRDQGLPYLSPTISPDDAAAWLELIVTDQRDYHHDNHHKLHCAERRMNWLTLLLFVLTVIAVFWQLRHGENDMLLLVTAAVPAFAAALHGVTTRLGFVHRIQLSQDAERELSLIHDQLCETMAKAASPEAKWIAVRKLAFGAAETMGQETRSWHSEVRRQKDELV